MYSIARLCADNKNSDPAHVMTLTADAVRLYSPLLDTSINVYAPSAIDCSIAVAGVNGYDNAPFTPLQTVWFYYIGSVLLPLATIASVNPPSIGPILPTGYTHFCPAFPMLIADDSSIQLKVLMWPPSTNMARTRTRIRGNRAYYPNAIYYDFPDFFPISTPSAPVPMRAFDVSWAVPQGIATVNLEIDAELHQTPGGQLIAGFILSWMQVGGVNQNDINISLYQLNETYTFPNAQDLVADFPVGPGAGLWGLYSVDGGGSITSTDFCVFVRGYSW